jgi:hypothetical protein
MMEKRWKWRVAGRVQGYKRRERERCGHGGTDCKLNRRREGDRGVSDD